MSSEEKTAIFYRYFGHGSNKEISVLESFFQKPRTAIAKLVELKKGKIYTNVKVLDIRLPHLLKFVLIKLSPTLN